MMICYECSGKGSIGEKQCIPCNGTGEKKLCNACMGKGHTYNQEPCEFCEGKGSYPSDFKIPVKVVACFACKGTEEACEECGNQHSMVSCSNCCGSGRDGYDAIGWGHHIYKVCKVCAGQGYLKMDALDFEDRIHFQNQAFTQIVE